MLNESNSRALKKKTPSNNVNTLNGGFGGNGSYNNGHFFEHPSLDEIMKFVTANQNDILTEPTKTLKMVIHFCQCDECRRIKEEMIQMEEEFTLALTILK